MYATTLIMLFCTLLTYFKNFIRRAGANSNLQIPLFSFVVQYMFTRILRGSIGTAS